jgi:beta-lactamase class A
MSQSSFAAASLEVRPHPELVEGRGPLRRSLILGAGLAALATTGAWAAEPSFSHITQHLLALESALGGQLGVYAYEVGGDNIIAWRENERFPMCSSFKVSLAAAVLEQVDAGRLDLDRKIAYGASDLLGYAPVTRAHLAEGAMSVRDLCAAAVTLSDNTAANLLLALIGGPAALTARWRAWGDHETRLDRNEPTLNSAIPGDPRDTTTPRAMIGTLRAFLVADTLRPASREMVLGWMRECQTGLHKLRAGFPADVIVGDKTGNNAHNTMGDIAIADAPGRMPILVAAYFTGAKVSLDAQDAAFAPIGRIISNALLGRAAA